MRDDLELVFQVEGKRNMTTSELIEILKEYPPNSKIGIRICGEMIGLMGIKGVMPEKNAETNVIQPVLDIASEVNTEKQYAMVIELKDDLIGEELYRISEFINNAFVNRGGTIKNKGTNPYRFEFWGNDAERGCLDLGLVAIENEEWVVSQIASWKWFDYDNPNECCDVLECIKEFN